MTLRTLNYTEMLVCLEGIDGAGKSTIAKQLADYLEHSGYKVHLTSEPTGAVATPHFKAINYNHLNYVLDRYIHFFSEGGILDYLDRGYIVICDRFILSTLAYQGLYMDIDFLYKLHKPILTRLSKFLTIFIDVDPKIALRRISKRDRGKFGGDLRMNIKDLRLLRDSYKKAISIYGRELNVVIENDSVKIARLLSTYR